VGFVGYSGLRLRAETGSKAWVIVLTMTATAVATYRQTTSVDLLRAPCSRAAGGRCPSRTPRSRPKLESFP